MGNHHKLTNSRATTSKSGSISGSIFTYESFFVGASLIGGRIGNRKTLSRLIQYKTTELLNESKQREFFEKSNSMTIEGWHLSDDKKTYLFERACEGDEGSINKLFNDDDVQRSLKKFAKNAMWKWPVSDEIKDDTSQDALFQVIKSLKRRQYTLERQNLKWSIKSKSDDPASFKPCRSIEQLFLSFLKIRIKATIRKYKSESKWIANNVNDGFNPDADLDGVDKGYDDFEDTSLVTPDKAAEFQELKELAVAIESDICTNDNKRCVYEHWKAWVMSGEDYESGWNNMVKESCGFKSAGRVTQIIKEIRTALSERMNKDYDRSRHE